MENLIILKLFTPPLKNIEVLNWGAKKQIGLEVFNIFLKSKHEISYMDSKVLKKGVQFKIVNNYVHVFLKKTVKIIKSLNNNLVCMRRLTNINNV